MESFLNRGEKCVLSDHLSDQLCHIMSDDLSDQLCFIMSDGLSHKLSGQFCFKEPLIALKKADERLRTHYLFICIYILKFKN